MLITRRKIRQMTDQELYVLLGDLWCAWRFSESPDGVLEAHLGMVVREVERRRRRRLVRGGCTCEVCTQFGSHD